MTRLPSPFRVSRPLPNPCAKGTLGYIPYSQIPRPADDQLVAAPTEFGRFAFASLYQGETTEKTELNGAILYGKTVLRAREPVKIKLLFSNDSLVFVNGQILGTTLGRGQWGFANLQEGDNLVELIMLPSPHRRIPVRPAAHRLGFPSDRPRSAVATSRW